jgi:hypothetical protein
LLISPPSLNCSARHIRHDRPKTTAQGIMRKVLRRFCRSALSRSLHRAVLDGGAIRQKCPALLNIGLDLDAAVIARFNDGAADIALSGDARRTCSFQQGDGAAFFSGLIPSPAMSLFIATRPICTKRGAARTSIRAGGSVPKADFCRRFPATLDKMHPSVESWPSLRRPCDPQRRTKGRFLPSLSHGLPLSFRRYDQDKTHC